MHTETQQIPTYVSFTAEINPHTTSVLINLMSQLVNSGVKQIVLLLSTPGGSVMHGLTLYNTLRGFPIELTTHNVGNVDSIGNAVFLAGSKRIASPHSTFMFHGVGFDIGAPVRLDRKILQERLDSLIADEQRIGDVIADRTRLSSAEISELFTEMKTKDASYALTNGFVDSVQDLQLPGGAQVHTPVF